MKVYVLIVESTVDYITTREMKVFANHKDAEKLFNEEVEKAKAAAREDWEMEESESFMSFSIYDVGYYAMNHIDVNVLEEEVK